MGGAASTAQSSKDRAGFATLLVGEVRKQKERHPEALDCDTLEKAQKEIKRFRYFCSLISEEDLENFIEERGSTLNKRAKLNDQEENHALGVLMAVKEKMSKRFVSLREAFTKMDVDNSGYVDKHEFLLSCQFWGLRLDEKDLQLMLSYQSNDEGALKEGVNYKSFLSMLTLGTDDATTEDSAGKIHTPSEETLALTAQLRSSVLDEVQTIQKAFEVIDVDKSGFIDANEMALVFEKFNVNCTKEMLFDLFEAYDTDQDNRFCYAEFEKVFQDLASAGSSEEVDHQKDVIKATGEK